jgi:tetratricopeptide (TPR) repeat protein/arylsulfatase A-like enzyme
MPSRPAKKVLLIGWDAADWQVIHPLLDSGQLPTLERFIDGGTIGNLASTQPLLSPLLWNSIATGKRPYQHGICGFIEPRVDGAGVQPISSTSRRVKALWNILSQNGLRSHVIGWYASHPAEPIHGVCVTNQFQHARGATRADWPLAPESVHPQRLEEKLASLRMHPAEILGEHLQPFIPHAEEIDQGDKRDRQPLVILSRLLAECVTIHNTATWLLAREPWDFAAVYYDAIDHFSHFGMRYHPPRLDDVGEREFGLYSEVVTGIYRFQDMLLARLLELAGPDTTTLVVSDHGFYSNHLRPRRTPKRPAGPTRWHRPYGIFCAHGPGIRVDERIYGATILDITPTILHLFGLPVGGDMDGRVLTGIYTDPAPVAAIPSWETVPGEAGLHPPERRRDPLEAREALRQLEELGYIEAPAADKQDAIRSAADELQSNLALAYMDGGKPAEAAPLFAALSAAHPQKPRYGLALAECYLALGRLADCRGLLEGIYGAGEATPPADLLMGIVLFAEGRGDEALARLLRAEQAAPRLPRLHNQLGAVYLKQRRWTDAERAFRRALEIDMDSPPAYAGLAIAARRQGRPQEAAEQALRAVGLQHFFPSAHLQLGLALAELGELPRAAQALETCLAMRPQMRVARRMLGRVRARQWLGASR